MIIILIIFLVIFLLLPAAYSGVDTFSIVSQKFTSETIQILHVALYEFYNPVVWKSFWRQMDKMVPSLLMELSCKVCTQFAQTPNHNYTFSIWEDGN